MIVPLKPSLHMGVPFGGSWTPSERSEIRGIQTYRLQQ